MSPDPWVFGYGSLVWRPAFAHIERVPAFIEGWSRRFWQASTDHRGTPGQPGRVVTLLAEPGARCDGMAYRVDSRAWPAIQEALDYREKAGYEHVHTVFNLADGRKVEGLVYIAGPGNPNFVGPAPLAEMAAQIRLCVGPSGANLEYLQELHTALKAMGADDAHIRELAEAVGI